MANSAGEFASVIAELSEPRPAAVRDVPVLRDVSVLGAGPVGQALACEFLAAGCTVSLHSAFRDELAALGDSVTVRGEHLVGTYRFAPATTVDTPFVSVREGIDASVGDADAVLIATPALAHATYAGLLARHVRAGQIVVLVPGRAFGAVEFMRALRRAGAQVQPTVVELASAPYLVSVPEAGRLAVAAVKRRVDAAAFPNRATADAVESLRSVLAMLVPAAGVLATTFGDVAGILHVAPALLSSAVPDAADGTLANRAPGALANTMLRRLDDERRRVAFAYGVRDLPSLAEWLALSYGVVATDLAEALAEVGGYEHVPVAPGVSTRVHDAVATSLVPLVSAARAVDVPVPAAESLVGVASVLGELDYLRHGRTLASLGLDAIGAEGVRRALDGGDAALMAEVLA